MSYHTKRDRAFVIPEHLNGKSTTEAQRTQFEKSFLASVRAPAKPQIRAAVARALRNAALDAYHAAEERGDKETMKLLREAGTLLRDSFEEN